MKFLHAVASIIIISLSIGCFYNSLNHDFTFDDNLALVNNGDVSTSDLNSLTMWGNDLWGKDIRANDSHKSYRPFLIKAFQVIKHKIGPETKNFRAFSIGFHAITSVLVYLTSFKFTKNISIAFGSAALFAAHPIHVEAVTAIVNMAESVHTILVLATFYIFVRSTESHSSSRTFFGTLGSTVVWFLLIVCSILFKETGLIGCGLIFAKTVMHMVLFTVEKVRNFFYDTVSPSTDSSLYTFWIYYYWNTVALLTCYLYFSFRSLLILADREALLASSWSSLLHQLIFNPLMFGPSSYLDSSQLIRKAENPYAFLHGTEKVLSMLYLHFRYMYQLLWPVEQSPEYSFNCIPSVEHLEDPRNLYWLLVYLSVLVLGVIGISHSCTSSNSGGTSSSAVDAASKDNKKQDKTESVEGSSDVKSCAISSDPPSVSRLPVFDYSPTALLDALIWLVVPFVPASGVVFKLGTLLAERLLYMCSIGFCLLVSILIYAAIRSVVFVLSKLIIGDSNRVRLYGQRFTKLVHVVAITAITVLYVQRTLVYNAIWVDNDTLFVESLKVCPTSAKMHVQVSKVYYNKNDFRTARKHVMKAKELDPDFCDVGYQEALLAIAIDNSPDDALRHALGNLRCVYSNSGSMQLVNQLWALETNPLSGGDKQIKLSEVLAKHAAQAVEAGMEVLGAKKFMEAGSIAFEAKQYKSSIGLNLRAEQVLQEVDAANRNLTASKSAEENFVPPELKCRVFALGGIHRAFFRDHIDNSVKKIKLEGVVKREMKRTKELLLKSLDWECLEHGTSAAVNGQHTTSALNYLSAIVTKDLDLNKTEAIEEYGKLLTVSYRLMSFERQQKIENGAAADSENDSTTSADAAKEAQYVLNLRNNAASVWNNAAIRYHTGKQNEEAVDLLEEALKLFLRPSDVSPRAAISSKGVTTAQLKKYLPNIELTMLSCNALYWYSDVLAGQPGFYESIRQIRYVIRVMKTYTGCSSHPDEAVRAAHNNFDNISGMIEKLENYIKPPPAAGGEKAVGDGANSDL